MKRALAVTAGLFLSLGATLVVAQEKDPRPRQYPDATKESFLESAEVVDSEAAGRGVTQSQKLTLSDGENQHLAHFQTFDENIGNVRLGKYIERGLIDSWKNNIAAYRIDRILGLDMVPVSVERSIENKTGALSWWVANVQFSELDRQKNDVKVADPLRWSYELSVMAVFDQLVDNADRNTGNILITDDWNIWLIDHSRAFTLRSDLRNPDAITRCDRKFFAALKKLDRATLQARLKPYLTDPRIDAILSRRDLIVKLLEKHIAEVSEAAVLYDYLDPPEQSK